MIFIICSKCTSGEVDRDTTELRIDLGDVDPGKTEEITYEVEVNSGASVSTEIEPANNVIDICIIRTFNNGSS